MLNLRLLAIPAVLGLLASATPARADDMLREIASPHTFEDTVARIERAAVARGLVPFGKLDHAAAASRAGLALRPTVVLMYGNPAGGTPVMQAHPSTAIDLPPRVLVWQGEDGAVRVAVNTAAFFARHGLSPEQAAPLAGIGALVEASLK